MTVRPPTIAIFCNDPALFGNTYRRYLEQVTPHVTPPRDMTPHAIRHVVATLIMSMSMCPPM